MYNVLVATNDIIRNVLGTIRTHIKNMNSQVHE